MLKYNPKNDSEGQEEARATKQDMEDASGGE